MRLTKWPGRAYVTPQDDPVACYKITKLVCGDPETNILASNLITNQTRDLAAKAQALGFKDRRYLDGEEGPEWAGHIMQLGGTFVFGPGKAVHTGGDKQAQDGGGGLLLLFYAHMLCLTFLFPFALP